MGRVFKILAILGAIGAVLSGIGLAYYWPTIKTVARDANTLAEPTSKLNTTDDLVKYVHEHPTDIAWLTFSVTPDGKLDESQPAIAFNADEPMRIASTAKIFVLAAVADAISQGKLDPEEVVPLEAWEAYYLPNSDGGAHESALKDVSDVIRVKDLAHAMIRHSDNAATDWFVERIGQDAIHKTLSPLDMDAMPEVNILGTFLLWQHPGAKATEARDAEIARMSQAERIEKARELRQRYASDATFRKKTQRMPYTSVASQLALSKITGPQSSARDLGRVVAGISVGAFPNEEAAAWAKDILDWPMELPGNQARFEHLGAKGGSLPGILTEAMYAQAKGAEDTKIAILFMENLSVGDWMTLVRSFEHQKVMANVLTDKQRPDIFSAAIE